MSTDERTALDVIENSMVREGDGWRVNLPWKDVERKFPDGRHMAEARAKNLCRKFASDPEYHLTYRKAMAKYVVKGYAREIGHFTPGSSYGGSDLRAERGQRYLPHHAVFKPDRLHVDRPEKLRVVFDGAAQVQGVSINDLMHTGPKLQNDIVETLMPWRAGPERPGPGRSGPRP